MVDESEADGPIARRVRRIERLLGLISSLLLLALMLAMSAGVFARYVIAKPIAGGDQVIVLIMAVLMFTGLPLVSGRMEHLTVGLIDPLLKGRARRAHEAVIALISALALTLLAWQLWSRAAYMRRANDLVDTLFIPFWPFTAVLAGMAALSTLVTLLVALRRFASLLQPRPRGAA